MPAHSPPCKTATRFTIDPATMSDQQILDMVNALKDAKLSAKVETGDVPEDEVEVDPEQ